MATTSQKRSAPTLNNLGLQPKKTPSAHVTLLLVLCQIKVSRLGFERGASGQQPVRNGVLSPTAWKELSFADNCVSLETDFSPVEPSGETPALDSACSTALGWIPKQSLACLVVWQWEL